MELEYDSRGRINSQKLMIGRSSSMERITYSADGHVLEVVGTSDWKFVYDENGNVTVSYTHLDVYKRQLYALPC